MDANYLQSLQPYVRIVEQPARSSVRFRYECEGRSAGPIPGANSTTTCATYPSIQIMNYSGNRAMVVVSCVTVAQPYRQHPHHLVGRMGCHNGICTMIVDNSEHLCTFTHLGIQCAKRNEITDRLKLRKQLQIDPTFGGFDHISKSLRAIDLGSVRLCFQVYLEGPESGKFCIALNPVISDPVYDKKLLSKLTITDISTTSTICTGGKVMIFCNYIDEEDIEVLFFECEPDTGMTVWQSFANLCPPYGEVHKRVGMSFMAPAYRNIDITHVVKCYMQLRRISDQEASDPIIFHYLPILPKHNCPFMVHFNSSRDYNIGNKCAKKCKTSYCNNNNNFVFKQTIGYNNNSITNETNRQLVMNTNAIIKFENIDNEDIEVNSSDNNSNTGEVTESVIKRETIDNPSCQQFMVNLWTAPQNTTKLAYTPCESTDGHRDDDERKQYLQPYNENLII